MDCRNAHVLGQRDCAVSLASDFNDVDVLRLVGTYPSNCLALLPLGCKRMG